MKRQFAILFLLFFVGCSAISPKVNECVEGNCVDGSGTMVWNDNTVYVGEWKDGLMNGRGLMRYANGTEYFGEWYQGKMHGKGELTYIDGSKKTGIWQNNRFVRKRIREVIMRDLDFKDCSRQECGEEYQSEIKDGSRPKSDNPSEKNRPVSVKLEVHQEPPSILNHPAKKYTKPVPRPYDMTLPFVEIVSPQVVGKQLETDKETLHLVIKALDESGIHRFLINDRQVPPGKDGLYQADIPLESGRNQIRIRVIDNALNVTEVSLQVRRSASR